ncbi:MAG: 30S ribosomal protein S21 [Candidatus Omnitrophica bacterium]|nr:30S ribosomal protein S21 [Candidatus Omnitrophota bacterium]
MPRVEVRDDESLEKALRRFKRMLEREGILKALKAKKHYEKPSERKRREMRQAISRRVRSQAPRSHGL